MLLRPLNEQLSFGSTGCFWKFSELLMSCTTFPDGRWMSLLATVDTSCKQRTELIIVYPCALAFFPCRTNTRSVSLLCHQPFHKSQRNLSNTWLLRWCSLNTMTHLVYLTPGQFLIPSGCYTQLTYTRSVQKVSSHIIGKIETFIEEDTRYKKHWLTSHIIWMTSEGVTVDDIAAGEHAWWKVENRVET